jgi:hypothetical protein
MTTGTAVASAPIYQRLVNSRAEAPIKAPVQLTAARGAND